MGGGLVGEVKRGRGDGEVGRGRGVVRHLDET